jgi:hypothetical protein
MICDSTLDVSPCPKSFIKSEADSFDNRPISIFTNNIKIESKSDSDPQGIIKSNF